MLLVIEVHFVQWHLSASTHLCLLFIASLFRVCPDAQVLFGFSLEMYTDPSELLGSRRFQMHASFLIEMIDETISFLGQDHEQLIKTCAEIGKKHSTYGVKPGKRTRKWPVVVVLVVDQ